MINILVKVNNSSKTRTTTYESIFRSVANAEDVQVTSPTVITTVWNSSDYDLPSETVTFPSKQQHEQQLGMLNNWWAMLALILVISTATGNILVCLAITWERRLQNVTNYFLMSLAITDLMVAILVMPLGIVTLVRGYFPLPPVYCLAWICLDVLFCTASIMHLCTISVDRYLSLRHPMKFGRNKTRRRVILKIVFVWLLSIAMSLPLSLMYSKDDDSVLVDGACQIPDPLYKLIGSIICFYIPLGVMLLTYALTVQLLAKQKQNIGGMTGLERRCTWKRFLHNKGAGGSSGTPQHTSGTSTDTELTTLDTHELWLPESDPPPSAMSALHAFGAEMLKLSKGLEGIATAAAAATAATTATNTATITAATASSSCSPSPTTSYPSSSANPVILVSPRSTQLHHQLPTHRHQLHQQLRRQTPPRRHCSFRNGSDKNMANSISDSRTSLTVTREEPRKPLTTWQIRRRASTYNETYLERADSPMSPTSPRKRSFSFHEHPLLVRSLPSKRVTAASSPIGEPTDGCSRENGEQYEGIEDGQSDEGKRYNEERRSELKLPPPCTCPYFGESSRTTTPPRRSADIVIVSSDSLKQIGNNPLDASILYLERPPKIAERSIEGSNAVVTWRGGRRGSSLGSTRTLLMPSRPSPLRRAATMRAHNGATAVAMTNLASKSDSSPSCLLRYSSTVRTLEPGTASAIATSHHSRTSSVISRNSSRHGRIIRLEQKATKVLGVVFFTFVILWAPFFVLNLVPAICSDCEKRISRQIFDLVTWLGYASSMVNPIFYTIFNEVFRQAFKKVLLCQYRNSASSWRPPPR